MPGVRVALNMKHMRNALGALLIGGTMAVDMAPSASATPVPAHFEPGSVSFTSPSQGFLLGTSPCGHAPCTALLSTLNSGKTWTRVPAPDVPYLSPLSPSPQGVSKVVFANTDDGWIYGPSLWSTNNEATSWRQINLGGPVFSLAASANAAYAVVGSCFPGANSCPRPSLRLEETTVGSQSWHVVSGISGYGSSGILNVNGKNAWVSLAPRHFGPASIWTTSDSGAKWRTLPDPCYQPTDVTDIAGVASPGGRLVFELCAGNPGAGQEGKSVRVSTNGGTTSSIVSRLPLGGLASGIAATATNEVFVTAASGASDIYSSSNAGRTWATLTFTDGGAGLHDLHFTTPSFGAAIEGQPQDGSSSDRLLLTHNGGVSWTVAES